MSKSSFNRTFSMNRKKRIGDLLVEEGIVKEENIEEALKAQKTTHQGQKIGAILIDIGVITDEQMATALHNQLGYESITLSQLKIEEDIIKLCDETVLRKNSLMPFEFSEKNPSILNVAMSDPLDIRAVDDISIITGFQVEIFITTQRDISAAIDRYYGDAAARRVADEFAKERGEADKEAEKAAAEADEQLQQAPIVKLVRQIIESAVHKRASDVHIEPMEEKLRIRFRVDGVMQEEMTHSMTLHSAMIARIKIISGLDISEKRKPQDGRATAIVDRAEYDIRVSLLPTVYGEKVVMRMTQKKALSRDKKDLGLMPDDLEKFDKILSRPNGIILVTGPTGSGKSTTLYTALSELNTEGVNIITVEDPVEANIAGINQVQTNEKAGLTFESALRSILRQDPDIIMIGEIRDGITADIAVKASITGHLVVSTLHTNSAASTISRLADMGIEDYLIADSVVGIIAQRLLRRVCPSCGVVVEADEFEREILGVSNIPKKILIKKPAHKDCMRCGGSGYYGRVGIYEIMPMTPGLKRIVAKGGTAEEIEKQALREGMKTLRQAGINYVLQGITTVDEVKRITVED